MAAKYHLNRYNWLGQKLLAQHNYEDILRLKQCLARQQKLATPEQESEPASSTAIGSPVGGNERQVSEHMIYLSSLALMQTSTHLDEVIFAVQRLNFENNNQYFLLLCRCLLYLGNHESVIALCEQVIAKEARNSHPIGFVDETRAGVSACGPEWSEVGADDPTVTGSDANSALSGSFDDGELRKLFQRAHRDHLVREPCLWLILGRCYEYQARARDALIAYKVSSNLALGAASDGQHHHHHHHHHHHGANNRGLWNNFHEPHLKYARLCIQLDGDFKRAAQVLSRAAAKLPQNYSINPLLSLISCSSASSNVSHYNRAIDMLAMLENYSASNRNPSLSYNNLALRCQRRSVKQPQVTPGGAQLLSAIADDSMISEPSIDDSKYRLYYLLIKIHLHLNLIAAQDSSHLFSIKPSAGSSTNLDTKMDQLINLMRGSHVSCWRSSSLWNNLAVCYLLQGKLIASLTCHTKAQQLNPLDWRISYNLGLACIQVGMVQRALISLIAARQLYEYATPRRGQVSGSSVPQMITSLMAVCFDKLSQVKESRRLHIEACRSQVTANELTTQASGPILPMVNYLIFLHKSPDSDDPQTVKLKLHLLDSIEQLWLQRNQNDTQFSSYLLDVANQIGQQLGSQIVEDGKASRIRKTYAWAKVDS